MFSLSNCISNGHDAIKNKFPWYVDLKIVFPTVKNLKNLCGLTISKALHIDEGMVQANWKLLACPNQ